MFLVVVCVFTLFLMSEVTSNDYNSPGEIPTNDTSKYYLRRLFQRYGHDGFITFEGFEHLLGSLGIGNVSISDHDVHDHFKNSTFTKLHDHHEHGGRMHGIANVSETSNPSDRHDHHGVEHQHHQHKNRQHVHQQHANQQDRHEHTKRSDGNFRRKRRRKHGQTWRHKLEKKSRQLFKRSPLQTDDKCLSASQLLGTIRSRFEEKISQEMFLHICPAIVLQMDTNVCSPHRKCPDVHKQLHCKLYHQQHSSKTHNHTEVTSQKKRISRGLFDVSPQVWGFATASVIVISFVGMLAVAVVPVMRMMFYNHVIQFLVALAVGTLTGDAFLHLLPHALAVEDESSHEHSEGHGHDHLVPVMKGLTGMAGLYAFFLAEQILSYVNGWRQRSTKLKQVQLQQHRHRHQVAERLSEHNRLSRSFEQYIMMRTLNRELPSIYKDDGEKILDQLDNTAEAEHMLSKVDESEDGSHDEHGHGHSHEVPRSIAAAAWMVIMGDGLHNFTDGIAIGAAFTQSFSAGLSTSIAIFCHELPHELGDFAMLLKAGMSVKQAFVCNVVSSILAFLGMLIGIAVGNIDGVNLWIFALIAGLFIYIALADMFPEMKNTPEGSMSKGAQIVLQNLGMLTGIGIMLTIALFEDKIKIPVSHQ